MRRKRNKPKNIVVVEFTGFTMPECEEHFFDKTPDQCIKTIFKDICPTAIIHRVIEYPVSGENVIDEFSEKQTDKQLFTRKKSMENNEKKIKDFWEKDGGDYHATLGIWKKAITVVPYLENGGCFGISVRSYFPFTSDQYGKRFDNIYDATIYAEGCIKVWVQSLFSIMDNREPLSIEEQAKFLNP